MALSNEELLQQVNMLATRTDDNKEMKNKLKMQLKMLKKI